MKKAIYIYQNSETGPFNFKIGKADQRVNQDDSVSIYDIAKTRVLEQQTAATFGNFTLVEAFDISEAKSSVAIESFIHTKLQLLGYTRLERTFEDRKGSTEWFCIEDKTPADVKRMVGSLIKSKLDKSGLKSYQPRFYQQLIKEQVLAFVDQKHSVIACELAPRFGKTLWSLDLFKTLCDDYGFQYMILPAYVLTAHSSFAKEVAEFEDFEDFVLIDDKSDTFEEDVIANRSNRCIITVSLHTPDSNLGKYDCLAALPSYKKVSFIDEADFGAHTGSSKRRLEILDPALTILMTGTAIERATSGYDTNAFVQWSYFDMLMVQQGIHPVLETLKKVA